MISALNITCFSSRGPFAVFITAALALLMSTSNARAHEFWLESSQYHVQPDELITLNLFIGEPFAGEIFGRHQKHIKRFLFSGEEVLGLEGSDAAGFLRPPEPGQYWAEYLSEDNVKKHSAVEFMAYLTEEGLLPFIDSSRLPPKQDQTVEEIYFRCAKTFIEVGSPTSRGRFQQPLAHPLEIVPQFDLDTLKPGQVASFLILINGKPLQNVPILAISKANPQNKVRLTSDSQGMVEFDQLYAGIWMFAAIVTTPTDPSTMPPAAPQRWQTYWASLTFEYAPAL